MTSTILTDDVEDRIIQAIDDVLPAIQNLARRYTWGPKGVVIAVQWPGNDPDNTLLYIMEEELGPESSWQEKWPGKDFRKTAIAKLNTSLHIGRPSSEAHLFPQFLQPGDSLLTGAVVENGIAVGVSGVKSEADEAIAWIVWNSIVLQFKLFLRDLRDQNITTVP